MRWPPNGVDFPTPTCYPTSMKITTLCMATLLLATPLLGGSISSTFPFPNLLQDGKSIAGSPLIGAPLTGLGHYLFFLEDTPNGDQDFNDLYGSFTDLGSSNIFQILGGLSSYYPLGRIGFNGTTFINGHLTMVFSTPSGTVYSGGPQVALYRIGPLEPAQQPSDVPEPATYLGMASGLLLFTYLNRSKR